MTDTTVFQDKEDTDLWRVEAMDYDGRTLFTGQDAKRRAQEYAEWLQMRVAKASGIAAPPGGLQTLGSRESTDRQGGAGGNDGNNDYHIRLGCQ
jgi:hypothetical protein